MSTATVGYDLLVGPLLIGVILNALAFGVCFMQLVTYALSGFSDRWMIIVLIVWVYAIDAFQVGSSVSMLWKYVVTNFANPQALQSAPWEYASLPIFSALASVPIQHYMAYRIFRFSRKPFFFGLVSILSLAQAATGCVSAYLGLTNTTIASHVNIIPVADAWLACGVACDTTITVLLIYYLSKSRTGFERTDSIIARICRTTVEAAVPVTILCILDLSFLTSTPNNNLHYMFALPVGRLYTNTLMSTLNERKVLRSHLENSTPNRGGISLNAMNPTSSRFQRSPAQVHIAVEQAVDVQMDSISRLPHQGVYQTSDGTNDYMRHDHDFDGDAESTKSTKASPIGDEKYYVMPC